MTIIDGNTMQSIEYVSLPFTAKINKFMVVIILEEVSSDGNVKARFAIAEQNDNILFLHDSVELYFRRKMNLHDVVFVGVGEESAFWVSNEDMWSRVSTVDSTNPSDVVVSHYVLTDNLIQANR